MHGCNPFVTCHKAGHKAEEGRSISCADPPSVPTSRPLLRFGSVVSSRMHSSHPTPSAQERSGHSHPDDKDACTYAHHKRVASHKFCHMQILPDRTSASDQSIHSSTAAAMLLHMVDMGRCGIWQSSCVCRKQEAFHRAPHRTSGSAPSIERFAFLLCHSGTVRVGLWRCMGGKAQGDKAQGRCVHNRGFSRRPHHSCARANGDCSPAAEVFRNNRCILARGQYENNGSQGKAMNIPGY